MKHVCGQTNDSRYRRLTNVAFEWVSAMAISLTLIAIVFLCMFRVVKVDGNSMEPSLLHGQKLLITRLNDFYTVGDVVIVDRYVQEPLIKRVIAVAGDTLDIRESGEVYRNGHLLTEPYIQGVTFPRDFAGEMTIPEGHLFVMGDNRMVSMDSRSRQVGMIPVEDVTGHVLFRLWPFSTVSEKVGGEGA